MILCPIQLDLMAVVAGREERRLQPDGRSRHDHSETEQIAVERGGAVKIGHLKVHVTDAHGGRGALLIHVPRVSGRCWRVMSER